LWLCQRNCISDPQSSARDKQVRLLRAALAATPSHRGSSGGHAAHDGDRVVADNELLRTRVDALGAIIALQEDAMRAPRHDTSSLGRPLGSSASSSQAGADQVRLTSGHGDPASVSSTLPQSVAVLRKWREKVFEMLVQERVAEARHAAELGRMDAQLDEALEAASAKETELSSLRAAVADKDVELRRFASRVDAANTAVQDERARRREAERERDAAVHAVSRLTLVVPRAEAELAQTSAQCAVALGRLDVLARRVSFATDRVKTCSHILSTDGARASGRGEAHEAEEEEEDVIATAVAAATSALETELESLRRERDFLVGKAEEHTRTLASRVDDARARFAAELADAETAAAAARAERDACEQARSECEARLAASETAAQERFLAAAADRERAVTAKQRELDICIAERDAALAEVERAVVDKTAVVAKTTARVVRLSPLTQPLNFAVCVLQLCFFESLSSYENGRLYPNPECSLLLELLFCDSYFQRMQQQLQHIPSTPAYFLFHSPHRRH